jgi:hypothetical protein
MAQNNYHAAWGLTYRKSRTQIAWNLTNSDGRFSRHNGLKETMLFVTIP